MISNEMHCMVGSEKNSNNQDCIDYEFMDLTSFNKGPFIMSSPLEVESIEGGAWDIDIAWSNFRQPFRGESLKLP